jgi:hypothetical protein
LRVLPEGIRRKQRIDHQNITAIWHPLLPNTICRRRLAGPVGCPLWVMCGRRPIGKNFFDVGAALVGAVMCAACLCGADGRWP